LRFAFGIPARDVGDGDKHAGVSLQGGLLPLSFGNGVSIAKPSTSPTGSYQVKSARRR
jgi:hypothetical protein